MYSQILLDHFENPRNAGDLSAPAITVEATNPVCGDIVRLSVDWAGGKVSDARFKARGCTACVAMGSVLTELVAGKTPDELRAIRAIDIDQALGGLINESKHVAVLGVDAVKAVLSKLPQAGPY